MFLILLIIILEVDCRKKINIKGMRIFILIIIFEKIDWYFLKIVVWVKKCIVIIIIRVIEINNKVKDSSIKGKFS